jgi:diguanylate cyclase (GGDEF)-like protein
MHDLAAENRELRLRLKALLKQAQDNEAKQRHFQDAELMLMGCAGAGELLPALLRELPLSFGLDAVGLWLVDVDYEWQRAWQELQLGEPDAVVFSSHAGDLAALFPPLPQVRLEPYAAARHRALFSASPLLSGSVALLPLTRGGELTGCLGLLSRDPARFTPGSATDFLARLAAVAAICLENAQAHWQLKRAGLTDALTGAHNRRYLDQRLAEEAERARRLAEPLCALLLDLDHFKRVNDQHGHAAGDAVLRAAAAAMRTQLRASDLLARYGGEEFCALLPGTDLPAALEAAERIRTAIAALAVPAGGALIRPTLSIGAARFTPGRGESLEAASARLLEQADTALYAAKQAGRNRVQAHG